MNYKEFSNLLLKLAGILILVLTVTALPTYVTYYAQFELKNFGYFISTVIVPVILPLALGVFLFNRPDAITNKYIGDDNDLTRPSPETFLRIEQIALTTLGFYLLFKSTSDLIYHFSYFLQQKASVQGKYNQNISLSVFLKNPYFISTIAEFIFAFWLIYKTKGIVKFISKIRETP